MAIETINIEFQANRHLILAQNAINWPETQYLTPSLSLTKTQHRLELSTIRIPILMVINTS